MTQQSKYPALAAPPNYSYSSDCSDLALTEPPVYFIHEFENRPPSCSMSMIYLFALLHIIVGLTIKLDFYTTRIFQDVFPSHNLMLAIAITFIVMGSTLILALICRSRFLLLMMYAIHSIWIALMVVVSLCTICLAIWPDSFVRQAIINSEGTVYRALNPHQKESIQTIAAIIAIYSSVFAAISSVFNSTVMTVSNYFSVNKTYFSP